MSLSPVKDILVGININNMDTSKFEVGKYAPGVGVGAVVINNNCLLLLKRQGAHGAGEWSVPGGKVDMWEHPFQTAVRETKEETGVVVKAVCSGGWADSQFRQDGLHYVTLWIFCEYISGSPAICEPEKCTDIAWVPLEKVRSLKLFSPLDQDFETLKNLYLIENAKINRSNNLHK